MSRKAPKQRREVQRQGRALKPRTARGAQYTVRDVPAHVDAALRRRAREDGKSLNSLLREALAREAGIGLAHDPLYHDLDHLAGRWVDDPEFDGAIAAQDRVDDELWR